MGETIGVSVGLGETGVGLGIAPEPSSPPSLSSPLQATMTKLRKVKAIPRVKTRPVCETRIIIICSRFYTCLFENVIFMGGKAKILVHIALH